MPLLPYVRRELFLQAIKTRDASALPDPNNREELFLKAIAEEVALIPPGVNVVLPAAVSEMLANLPEAHTHTELFYKDIIDAILVATTVTDTTPYLIRGTADHAPVSSPARILKKLGNTKSMNQLVQNGNFESTSYWSALDASLSVSDNVGTFTATAQNGYIRNSFSTVNGHKYIAFATVKISSGKASFEIYNTKAQTTLTGSFETLSMIYEASSTGTAYYPRIYDLRESGWDAVSVKNVFIIDLTLWFGSNDAIPSHLLSHPEDWGRYYAGSLAYNAGTLESADGTVLKSIGRNVWDEEWELGALDTTTGANYPSTTRIRSKNYIEISPNTAYYNYGYTLAPFFYDGQKNFISYNPSQATGNFTTPSNAHFMRFYRTATTYNHDITISLYYPDESGYDQYYPYTVLAEVDTGSEVLHGWGSHRDTKVPLGQITRVIKSITLNGTQTPNNYSFGGSQVMIIRYALDDAALTGDGTDSSATVGRCAQLSSTSRSMAGSFATWGEDATAKNTYSIHINGLYVAIGLGDTSLDSMDKVNTYLSSNPITIYYALATPTTEQGTAFNPVYAVDRNGVESWTNLKGIPQAHETEYTEWTT